MSTARWFIEGGPGWLRLTVSQPILSCWIGFSKTRSFKELVAGRHVRLVQTWLCGKA